MKSPLFNIDRQIQEVGLADSTGASIDGFITTLAYMFVEHVRQPEWLWQQVTHSPRVWSTLRRHADRRVRLVREGIELAIYGPRENCGFIRTYRYRGSLAAEEVRGKQGFEHSSAEVFADEGVLISALQTENTIRIFRDWRDEQARRYAAATQMAEGRISNTSVERAVIIGSGKGCLVCGAPATRYAHSTVGSGSAVMFMLQLCAQHLEEVQTHPSVLSFMNAVFSMGLDLSNLIKTNSIPKELIDSLAEYMRANLGATSVVRDDRDNGTHLAFTYPSGWQWKLRLRTFTDYAYVLTDPSEVHKAKVDSAAHHPDVPFGPDHWHVNATKKVKRDTILPSFTYGLPLFDFTLLYRIAKEKGAIEAEEQN
ncbi:hypothetical protein HT746_29615 [Burkholderia pyrrocinia]|uniref:hypothetical protein n=1 Tax=Burkholderia pyrrocinia TaxID=60550 RepID=UPI001576E3DE|nr:hypothetical protein [Burkholderia pyrrocinia]NTX31232.1 hypothetical protein [Burkholderia pyrrocinia]